MHRLLAWYVSLLLESMNREENIIKRKVRYDIQGEKKLFLLWLGCREYLATFKKTVAMHEVFLQRLAAHPVLRQDVNFEVFLEYSGDVRTYFSHVPVNVLVRWWAI